VLDIGSGPGGLALKLNQKGCQVAIVDRLPPQHVDPKIRVHIHDLDQPPDFDVAGYDHLLMLDIVEHLKDPERFLEQLRSGFDHRKKTLILTTPNVAFIVPRLMLQLGQFNYGKAGILDRTHTRLFTFRSLRYLLRDSGFRIQEVRGVPAPFPKILGNGVLGRAAISLNLALIRLSKTLFSYQIYVRAESTPDVDFLLRDTQQKSATRVPKRSATGNGASAADSYDAASAAVRSDG
jgi:hypothetical protein